MNEAFGAWCPDWSIYRGKFEEGLREPPVDDIPEPVWIDQNGTLTLFRPAPQSYRLRFEDQICVDVRCDDRVVREVPLSGDIAKSTRDHFLVDQVLPRILGQQGKLVLHAAAVRLGQGAVLLLGKSGAGKSSLAADFHGAGYALLGDDALIISWPTELANVRAVYPSLRLFPDSIEAVLADDVETASVAHYTPKLRVDVPLKDGGENRALQIRAIFVLSGRSGESVLVERKSVAEACMALVENSFVLDPTDIDRATGRLHEASRLAREVPAFDLDYPRAYSRLSDVRAAILDAVNGLPGLTGL